MNAPGKIEWFKTWPEARACVNQLRASGVRAIAMDMGDHITVIITRPLSQRRLQRGQLERRRKGEIMIAAIYAPMNSQDALDSALEAFIREHEYCGELGHRARGRLRVKDVQSKLGEPFTTAEQGRLHVAGGQGTRSRAPGP